MNTRVSARACASLLLMSSLAPACGGSSHHTPDPDVIAGRPDQPENGLVSVDETLIRAEVQGNELVVHVPVTRVSANAVDTKLQLDLTAVSDLKALASETLTVKVAGKSAELTGRLPLGKTFSEQADLVRFNLHLHDGAPDGLSITRSAFAALPRYEVRLEGPARVSADRKVSYRVRAHDPQTFAAVSDAKVSLELTREGEQPRVLEALTDAHGDAFFELALDEAGDYAVRARAQNAGTLAQLSESVLVESGSSRLLLTTDKPLYQPGQLVHLRGLALNKGDNKPVAKAKVKLEIRDGKGNKIFKRELVSDGYGIVATSFRLGSVLNMGTFQASVESGELSVSKAFEVSRYVLPKFAVAVALDAPWYRAGQKLTGTVDARYFFGKDVAGGDVEVTAYSVDIGQNMFGRALGKTNESGLMAFAIDLPDTLVGLPLEQGHALVSLHVKVSDSAGQVVEKDAAVIVANEEASLLLVPEATALIPHVENRVHAFVSAPDGSPLKDARIVLSTQAGTVEAQSDAFGQAVLTFVPGDSDVLEAQLFVGEKLVTRSTLQFASQAGQDHVLVRADRAVYDVGETAKLEIVTTADEDTAYVDVLHEGQQIDQRTLDVKDRKASFELPLDTSFAGNTRVEAYVVDAGGNVVRAGSTLFVRNGGALSVALDTDKPSYEPGTSAALTFSVTDEQGKPQVAALGVQIVDEAVFGLVDAKPGLLRTYFELDDAFATPHYQIAAPGGDIPSLVFDETRAEDAGERNAAQARARATFAALGDMSITGLHTGSWQETLARVAKLLEPTFMAQSSALQKVLDKLTEQGSASLAVHGCTAQVYYCDQLGSDYGSLLTQYVGEHLGSLYDPWGSAYTSTQDWGALVLTSSGPDELKGTADDHILTLQLTLPGGDGDQAGGPFPAPPGAEEPNDGDWGGDGDLGDGDAAGDGDDSAAGDGDGDGDGDQGSARVRRDFPETLYVNPSIITGPDGKARVEVPLADSITEWRVSSLANGLDGKLGGATHGIRVFQDFFVDVSFPAQLTRGDEVSFPIALYNYLDEAQSVTVSLESAPWYTPTGSTTATIELAAGSVKGLSFPVRVNDVGLHTLTVKAVGKQRSDAVERAVRVVPDGKAFPTAQSAALGSAATLSVSYPENAVPGSGELALTIFPAFLSSAVAGMDSILAEPNGCFEQTTSTTWPNVLVLRYLRDTQQITPEIQLKAESLISTGYQRLLTFEHPTGGFSWFGVSDGKPFLSVTAFGVMEFADMAAVHEVDEAMVARTIEWLAAQQKADGTWEGDQTEFFSFHTNQVRNTAFVLWALASAGYQGGELERGLGYLRQHFDDDAQDGYTLALVANALAAIAPNDATLGQVFSLLDSLKKVEGEKVWWDAGDTHTDFYGAGNDAAVTATALVAHALLLSGSSPDLAQGAVTYLSGARDPNGNFGSTQATIWTLRTLLLAAKKGTKGAVGTLTVAVDGNPVSTVSLSEDQSDVMTTLDLSSLATTGAHEVLLSFAGTGRPSYNLVSNYHVPWSAAGEEPRGPLAVSVSYDRTSLSVNEIVAASVSVQNLTDASVYMTLVDVGIPPGFAVETEDLDAYVSAGQLSRYELTARQLILYVTQIAAQETLELDYRLRATMPVKASDGGARVFPYYEPDRESHAKATLLEVLD